MPGALGGVRIIDFGQYIDGILAAVMLADEGADVVRVDPPGGPRRRPHVRRILRPWQAVEYGLGLKDADDLAMTQRFIVNIRLGRILEGKKGSDRDEAQY